MPNTERITARIIELLQARDWTISPFEDETDCWVVAGGPGGDVLLSMESEPVSSYLGSLIAGYLPHEAVDGVGTGPIEEELAATVTQSLDAALGVVMPGVLTEVGIRNAETGAEIYSMRALRASQID
ncbi:MAG TPA: hypothetical protein VGK53_00545 [Propionicimonas sp.]|jgi:hypothetical protein